MSRSWIHASQRACSASACRLTWPGGASATTDHRSSSRPPSRSASASTPSRKCSSTAAGERSCMPSTIFAGVADRVERLEVAGGLAGEGGARRDLPELVDPDEVGDHVAHGPSLAPAGGGPLRVVEPREELDQPAALAQERDRRVADRPGQLQHRRAVVAGREEHGRTVPLRFGRAAGPRRGAPLTAYRRRGQSVGSSAGRMAAMDASCAARHVGLEARSRRAPRSTTRRAGSGC